MSAMNPALRRVNTLQLTPAETAIRNAMLAVEQAGADPLLTDAVNLLQQARDKVADYVDRHQGVEVLGDGNTAMSRCVRRVANTAQCMTGCSDGLTNILTQELTALVDEVIRKAVEP